MGCLSLPLIVRGCVRLCVPRYFIFLPIAVLLFGVASVPRIARAMEGEHVRLRGLAGVFVIVEYRTEGDGLHTPSVPEVRKQRDAIEATLRKAGVQVIPWEQAIRAQNVSHLNVSAAAKKSVGLVTRSVRIEVQKPPFREKTESNRLWTLSLDKNMTQGADINKWSDGIITAGINRFIKAYRSANQQAP